FFQADDGIRDFHVTGVQTCALPIFVETKSIQDGPVAGGFYDDGQVGSWNRDVDAGGGRRGADRALPEQFGTTADHEPHVGPVFKERKSVVQGKREDSVAARETAATM